jgi:hypothetical protein
MVVWLGRLAYQAEALAKSFRPCTDVQRLDIGDLADPVLVAPGEEPLGGAVIGLPGVLLRIVAAKNSRKRRAAWSPASATTLMSLFLHRPWNP